MYRWQSKVLPWFSLMLLGCGFADLRPIGIGTIPKEPNEILPQPFSPAALLFDTEVEKGAAEALLQVGSENGTVEGDLSWEGRRLNFVPLKAWKPGIRYVLRLSGTLEALDGRSAEVMKSIPFFAPADSSRPFLAASCPEEGASTGVSVPGEPLLELEFSLPMDRKSTEEDLQFPIPGRRIFTWTGDDKRVSVSSDQPLEAWTLYHWSLSEKVLGRDGAPLAKSAEGRFITDRDRVFPALVRIMPVTRGEGTSGGGGIWGEWVLLAPDLEGGLGSGQALGLEFNKPMGEGVLSSISFEPSLAGRTEQLSSRSFVFIPEKDPAPETKYTLKLPGRILDAGGLSLGEDYRLSFPSDIPYLKLLSLAPDGEEAGELTEPVNRGCYSLPIDISRGGAARFILQFSLPFEAEAVRDAALAVELEPFFPPSLPAVFLRFSSRILQDRIRMVWEGLEEGTAAEPHYYRLRIPGGGNGVHNGQGSYLPEDLIIYFKAELP